MENIYCKFSYRIYSGYGGMDKNYQEMFNILEMYLKNKVHDVDSTILQAVKERKNGKIFTLSEHIKGLVFSLLSNQRDWGAINQNRKIIEQIFFNFDSDKIKATDYNYFINELKARKLGNRAINAQMKCLNYNIEILEKLSNKYGSLDKFVTSKKPQKIVKILSNGNSKYKLKQVGMALACEYIRNIGIDTVKPDVHIIRILGRLGLLKNKDENEAINVMESLSLKTGYSKVFIDYLLWHFCAEAYGNICSANMLYLTLFD